MSAEHEFDVSEIDANQRQQQRVHLPAATPALQPLPLERLERTEAWGQASSALNYVYRPTTTAGLHSVFELARETGHSVGLRGAGRSYGDAALNGEHILLDLSRMNRILDWDPEGGVISVEPGVTYRQLWRYVLGDGWWPPVVPGTMYPTLGGCVAMNIHGKNNWQAGSLGDHVLEFEALLPTGEELRCSRQDNADLFHALIGGFGMFGCFTRLTIQLKRVYSGRLRVTALAVPDVESMVAQVDALKDSTDYVVGWADGLARGRALGRGQIHTADYLPAGADPAPAQSLRVENQDLPDNLFGLVPKSIVWRLMRPFLNNPWVRLVNAGKYWSSRLADGHVQEQSFAEFNFLLDYIPHWKKAYLPGGLIQYQGFIPKESAAAAFRELLTCCQAYRLPTYLGVVKRHRPDDFLFSYSVDGFSLAMDFRVTRRNRARLAQLARELDAIVLQAGGRFYFAKDSTLDPETVRAFWGAERLTQFKALKARCDPAGLLQTNLSRRVLPAA